MENSTDQFSHNVNDMVRVTPYLIITFMVILGVVGNAFVVVAVFTYRTLRIVPNYYIASLAVADFLVALIIMPFGLYSEINRGHWYLGEGLCKTWIILDVMLSTSSILHLFIISRDRLRAITKPVKYAFNRTNKAAATRIFGVFLLSGLVSMPALFVSTTNGNSCGFTENPVYIITSSLVSFYIPCSVMLVMYYRIYKAASKRARRPISPSNPPTVGTRLSRTVPEIAVTSRASQSQSNETRRPHQMPRRLESSLSLSAVETQSCRSAHVSLRIERKAARVIAIVVGVFVSCWLPFFTLHVTSALCRNCTVTREMYVGLSWLGWSNSVINPIIYTVFNKEFRSGFKRIIHCRFKS
ncbi:probable G-protein coupled receptor No18 [Amphiura filiformis]|uniref:probable G-protein coupled receptor No18 n=1 Tax=Amphiura filiformis TaxID=82378 RepID=UPI003B20F6B4